MADKDERLKGRVALVTGGGRGIGQAICMALAQAGADVAVNYRRDDAAARETVKALTGLGVRASAYAASVDDWEQDAAMVAQVEADLGPVSILVNNAGIASRGQSVVDTDIAEMQRVLATHAMGAFYMSKLVLPGMRTQPRGDIVMISSTASRGLGANGAPYNMAKTAMEALATTLFKEERQHNIRVNTVCPGLVETEMGRRLMRATAGVDDLRKLDSTSAFGKVCQPEDIAEAVLYFATSSYVTGEKLHVDGGSSQMR